MSTLSLKRKLDKEMEDTAIDLWIIERNRKTREDNEKRGRPLPHNHYEEYLLSVRKHPEYYFWSPPFYLFASEDTEIMGYDFFKTWHIHSEKKFIFKKSKIEVHFKFINGHPEPDGDAHFPVLDMLYFKCPTPQGEEWFERHKLPLDRFGRSLPLTHPSTIKPIFRLICLIVVDFAEEIPYRFLNTLIWVASAHERIAICKNCGGWKDIPESLKHFKENGRKCKDCESKQ
jgi:hypothetical protein